MWADKSAVSMAEKWAVYWVVGRAETWVDEKVGM